MIDVETISKGLGRKFDADELASVESETAVHLANGVTASAQETGDFGYALDCMILSARVYLDQAERLREIYLNGLH